MRRRGRPILGAFSGFFFGFFLALTLLFLGVIPLDSLLLIILPIVFLIIVPLIAYWSPFGGSKEPESATSAEDVTITPVDGGLPDDGAVTADASAPEAPAGDPAANDGGPGDDATT